ncbi:MAG: CoA transferase, partial [Dehalococcoidia bacterium]|nr:CoA transferase [Dehalococcoidia bacterium]
MDSSEKAMKSALSGIRALELAEIWAGPFCGVLLGDMGAEVIKVEAVQRIARGVIKPAPVSHGYPDMDPGERPWNRSGAFNAVNRNKKGITLDLTRPAGVEMFKELVSVSDVVFTNYAYGVMDKFGLGYEELRKVKPDIIALFTPGFGNTGPYRGFRSMGMVIDAITGHTALR